MVFQNSVWIFIHSQHDVLAAVAAGRHVILCTFHSVWPFLEIFAHVLLGGHTNTERGYLPILASRLRDELAASQGPDAPEVLVSEEDRHPLVLV